MAASMSSVIGFLSVQPLYRLAQLRVQLPGFVGPQRNIRHAPEPDYEFVATIRHPNVVERLARADGGDGRHDSLRWLVKWQRVGLEPTSALALPGWRTELIGIEPTGRRSLR
jgi:hypothetical protein